MGYYKASDGQEVANAVSIGNTFGFSSFICSDTPVSRSLDVAAHEYTHSFRATAIGSLVYSNITGALEESYADIMGNLTEMSINPEGCDTKTGLSVKADWARHSDQCQIPKSTVSRHR